MSEEIITKESVEKKIASGDKLTDAETKFVMSYPNPDEGAVGAPDSEEEELKEEDFEDVDEDKNKEKTADSEKNKDKKEDKMADSAKSGDKKDDEDTSASKKKDEDPAKDATDKSDAGKEEKSDEKQEEGALIEKINKELDKPAGQEDLTNFTNREKGLFYALKKERDRRHSVEEDRDALKFEKVKKDNEDKVKQQQQKDSKEVEDARKELKEILDKEDEDFLTRTELKRIEELKEIIHKSESSGTDSSAAEVDAVHRRAYVRIAEMNARDIITARGLKGEDAPDYEKVMALADDILTGNKDYTEAIKKAARENKNPALIAYDLIRKDPSFQTLYKPGTAKKEEKKDDKEEKSKDGQENLKKIDKNLKKKPTSANLGGGGSSGVIKDNKGQEYSLFSLLNMSSSDFRKVPKEVREKFLEQT